MASERFRRALRWFERTLIVLGVVCLAAAYVTWHRAAEYQRQQKEQLAELVAAHHPPTLAERSTAHDVVPDVSAVIGELDIPRLGLSVVVLEGDDDQTLMLAAGHLPDTPLPWADGNAVIAGHRDLFFRPLRNVRLSDDVRLVTPRGTFEYRVIDLAIVDPDEIHVLAASPGVSLTLITCYPFYHVGPAPRRFIVRAERVSRS